MFYLMVIAHLIGDYLLQFNCIARWKARSVWGVVAHGAIVTATAWVCTLLFAPAWWTYALLIGVLHTGIDIIRARLIHPTSATSDLVYYGLDQAVHIIIIGLVVHISDPATAPYRFATFLTPRVLGFAIGYLMLLQPSWVMLRFTVRGLWGETAAPHLGAGEKFEPMMERVLITTSVMFGHFYLIPLILLPRRVSGIQVQSNGMAMWMRLTAHWAETFMSVLVAISVGLVLRIIL